MAVFDIGRKCFKHRRIKCAHLHIRCFAQDMAKQHVHLRFPKCHRFGNTPGRAVGGGLNAPKPGTFKAHHRLIDIAKAKRIKPGLIKPDAKDIAQHRIHRGKKRIIDQRRPDHKYRPSPARNTR